MHSMTFGRNSNLFTPLCLGLLTAIVPVTSNTSHTFSPSSIGAGFASSENHRLVLGLIAELGRQKRRCTGAAKPRKFITSLVQFQVKLTFGEMRQLYTSESFVAEGCLRATYK
mmetsp:Transcript_20950/g.37115  ORF Transcript_20950/g.37115 Transcript_20950/m.37115 type:complete len:113 (+) Transcript_20950:654-992(+)